MALAIVMVWYVGIGALAAAGSMYLSHGFVPAKHEATLYGGREATKIPLAYGAFCTTFDWAMAVYFVYRRRHWVAA